MNSTNQKNLRRLFLNKKWRESLISRSIVSQNFKLKEEWDSRLSAPVFKKINMGEFFFALDKKFTQENRGSAIDVDIFANNVSSDSQAEHMEELLYKLRRTPHTVHTPASTHHAAVRAMLDHGDSQNLVKMLDDRMNYGIFLDEYSSVLALDELLERGEVKAATRCASQLMLQEESFPLPSALGNLACWRYITTGREDPWFYPDEIPVDKNPDEVIRVKVKVVPNDYNDHHFDLRDPDRILGKTLIHFNADGTDTVSRSLNVLGNHLYGDEAEVVRLVGEGEVAEAVLQKIGETDSEPLKTGINSAKSADVDIEKVLLERVSKLEASLSNDLMTRQKKFYSIWISDREEELNRQYEKMQRAARIEAISQTKADLAKTEEKLFFFDNLDRYEMEKEEKVRAWRRTLPRTDWNIASYPMKAYYKKTLAADGERKVARWEKREQKKGPAK